MGQAVTCGYHFTAKPVSFGRGQSPVHTSAYNARTQLLHEREGRLTKDYSKHPGEVLFQGILRRPMHRRGRAIASNYGTGLKGPNGRR